MKFIKDNIVLILWAIVVGVTVFQIKSCSDPKPVNETAIRNDEKLKAKERELVLMDSFYRINIALLDSQNAALTERITINKASIQQSNERIKTLPARSASMPINEVISTIEQ